MVPYTHRGHRLHQVWLPCCPIWACTPKHPSAKSEQLAIPGVTQPSCYFKYFVRTIPRRITAHSCRSVPGRSRPSVFGVPAAHLLQRVLTPSKQGQLAPRLGFLSIWYRERASPNAHPPGMRMVQGKSPPLRPTLCSQQLWMRPWVLGFSNPL